MGKNEEITYYGMGVKMPETAPEMINVLDEIGLEVMRKAYKDVAVYLYRKAERLRGKDCHGLKESAVVTKDAEEIIEIALGEIDLGFYDDAMTDLGAIV